MRATVHPDLELSGTILTDTYLGVRYFLTPDAAWLCGQLRREPHIDRLAPAVARRRRITLYEARRAIYSLLGLLDAYGGVRVQTRSFRWHGGPRNGSWRRRYRGTMAGFINSSSRAYAFGIVASIGLFAGLKMTIARRLPAYWVYMPAGLLATCVLHEGGHALAARVLGIRVIFLARMGGAAVLYARPPRKAARLIALCGPLGAVAGSTVAAFCTDVSMVRLLWLIAGVLHSCSILPFLADGKTIWRTYE